PSAEPSSPQCSSRSRRPGYRCSPRPPRCCSRGDSEHALRNCSAKNTPHFRRGPSAMIWWIVIGTVVGCYLLKLVGYLVPARVLDHGPTRRAVELLPVALLAALVVVELIANGSHYDLDGPRLAGFAV